MKMRGYLSLNAFKIRSTSTSLWKADASRLRSLSKSTLEEEVAGNGDVESEVILELSHSDDYIRRLIGLLFVPVCQKLLGYPNLVFIEIVCVLCQQTRAPH